jgi:hypothetical protein
MRVDLARVPEVLTDAGWLGTEISVEAGGMRRIASDLVLGVGAERPVTFRKSMVIGLGRVVGEGDGYAAAIEWQSANLVALFPVFVGRVEIGCDLVAIEGHYAPPFGLIGTVLDRALLGIAARATARFVLNKLIGALGGTGAVPMEPTAVDTDTTGALY